MSQQAHRLAALCFADIAGYTELSARNEGEALALVAMLQDVARETVEDHGGRVVKFIGDAVLTEFTSTYAAVRSAIDLRDRFAADARSRGLEERDVRVGVHLGEIVAAADGDVYGDGVNLASRIHGAAEPGHVWVSEDVWRQLRQRPEFRFESRGAHELKGIAAPVTLYGVQVVSVGPDAALGWTAGAAAPRKSSVAVLPFTNMSPIAENEYFSDGVTEEILTLLARIEGLKVISRTSVMRYKGTDKPVRQIGRELGVASILEGSVRQAGQRVRITAQLIDAATDEHLWAERYDRDLEDIFAIQTDVAERIVEALRVRLTSKEQARLVERPTLNVEAYQSYLKGRYFLSRRREETLRQAIEWLQKAVTADPAFAQAWAGLADAHALLPVYGSTPAAEANREARACAERALALDPGLGEAHAALGFVAQSEWKWEEAEKEYRRALELAPGYATAHHWFGLLLVCRGRFEEAFAILQRALEMDPLSLPIHTAITAALNYARRYEEAIAVSRTALELDPDYAGAHHNLASLYLNTGRYAEALSECAAYSRLAPERLSPDLVAELQQGYGSGGEQGFWQALVGGLQSHPELWGQEFDMALGYAKLGKGDEAFALIDRMLDERSMAAIELALDPGFDSLRSDPRFDRVLEKLGLR